MSKPKNESQIDVPDNLFKELLTPSELLMVKQRFYIISLLRRGLSIRAVAQRGKVGTDTVVRVARKFEESKKLQGFFEEKEKVKSASKWVFGSVEVEKD